MKCALAKTLGRYMVLIQSVEKLMIMRPFQVYAVQHLVKCIDDDNGNGFVWHTTGSGKTLTSFKVPGVAPRAGMHRPFGATLCANGATAYQRRLKPWKGQRPGCPSPEEVAG